MDQLLHRKVKRYSFITMIVLTIMASIAAILVSTGIIYFGVITVWEIFIVWLVFMFFPTVSIITSYFLLHPEIKWIRKLARIMVFVFPLLFFACFFLINSPLLALGIAGIIILLSVMYIVLLQLFVFSNPEKLSITIVFLILIFIGIILKRYHLPMAGVFLTGSLACYSIGSYLFGIRCLYYISSNSYLRLTVFLGGCVITLFFMGMLFKYQHWPGHPIMIPASQVLLVAGTISVLLTLPSSGFFEWQEMHRRILKRMILPWVLMFLLFVLRYLLPEVDAVIWTKDDGNKYPGFEMFDYEPPPVN